MPADAVLTALTTGRMSAQAQRLSPADRIAVAEFVTGKTVSTSSTAGGRCVRMRCEIARVGRIAGRGARQGFLERLGRHSSRQPVHRKRRHQGSGRAAAKARLGVRIPAGAVGADAADRGGRLAVHRERIRPGICAGREDRVHPLDVSGQGRRAQRDERGGAWLGQVRRVFRRRAGQRVRVGRGDRQGTVDGEGGIAPQRGQ